MRNCSWGDSIAVQQEMVSIPSNRTQRTMVLWLSFLPARINIDMYFIHPHAKITRSVILRDHISRVQASAQNHELFLYQQKSTNLKQCRFQLCYGSSISLAVIKYLHLIHVCSPEGWSGYDPTPVERSKVCSPLSARKKRKAGMKQSSKGQFRSGL